MTNKLDIYFVRHTEPLIEAGTCYGQLDCAVTDDYAHQLKKISHYFKDKNITAIYSSPLQRCAKLAEDLAYHKNLSPVIYKDDLKELHFGDWEGVKWDDIPRNKIDEWNNNRLHFQFPNGESPDNFIQRVLAVYAAIHSPKNQHQEKSRVVLVIAHAGVIRTVLANVFALSFTDS